MLPIPTREDVLDAYRRAIQADQHYSEDIRYWYGPGATRWTISKEQCANPAIKNSLLAKIDAYNEWEALSRARQGSGLPLHERI